MDLVLITRRFLCTSLKRMKKVQPSNLKNKSVSSQQWLIRQINDPYIEKAKQLNYRCRSSFKLIEIDDRFSFLHPGHTVIDCGASPGSWTQVAVKRVNSDASLENEPIGKVISIDKQPLYPIHGATLFGGMDFTKNDSQEKIIKFLGDDKAHAIISDMAPSATGVRDLDNENMINLCYTALRFALIVSRIGATFLVKLWHCGDIKEIESNILRYYGTVKFIKPDSSRADSTEMFLLARNFKGVKRKV